MNILIFQHVPFEGPAMILDWAHARGHRVMTVHTYRGDRLPPVDAFDFCVILGGPMSILDAPDLPWLAQEMEYVRSWISAERPVLGICLGAQMLAHLLGARIFRSPHKEIGWFPVRRRKTSGPGSWLDALPEEFPAFHWHGETFDLPENAAWLAESQGCAHQAFTCGRNLLGMQFHLESNEESVRQLIGHCRADLAPGKFVQKEEDMLRSTEACSAASRTYLFAILEALTARH